MVLLLLAGGAIINVAVAWTLALQSIRWPTMDGFYVVSNRSEPRTLLVETCSATGAMSIEASGTHRLHVVAPPWLPSWSHARALSDTELQGGVRMSEQARGWPCLSLYWRRIDQPGNLALFEGGLPISSDKDTALPLLPIWTGFAINSVIFAVVSWPITFALLALRRSLRIKRGLCPKCAYDLRGTPGGACPECGSIVAS